MSHSKGVPAIASHLTLEEREVIAHMHRAGGRRYVIDRLRQRWSPDQIAGRSRSDFPHDRRRQISPPTIYAWIRAEEARVSIEGRPAVVDRRSRYGDWEGDTIVGANHHGGTLTLVERKSGYLLLGRGPNLQAGTVGPAAAQRQGTTPGALR